MLVFQKIVIVCTVPAVAVTKQNISITGAHRKYRHTVKGAIKSFLIPHKITTFSPEHAGSGVYVGRQTENRNTDTKCDPGCRCRIV